MAVLRGKMPATRNRVDTLNCLTASSTLMQPVNTTRMAPTAAARWHCQQAGGHAVDNEEEHQGNNDHFGRLAVSQGHVLFRRNVPLGQELNTEEIHVQETGNGVGRPSGVNSKKVKPSIPAFSRKP